MLVVDVAGDAYPSIGHAPWDGLHLADFVMPYFLLICGISAALSPALRPRVDSGSVAKSHFDLLTSAELQLRCAMCSELLVCCLAKLLQPSVLTFADVHQHSYRKDFLLLTIS